MRERQLTDTLTLRVTGGLRALVDAEAERLQLRPADVGRMALARGLEAMKDQAGTKSAGVSAGREELRT